MAQSVLPDSLTSKRMPNIVFGTYPNYTFLKDPQSGRLFPASDEDTDAIMRQAIEIIVNVERYKFIIYKNYYGMEWRGLIGHSLGIVMSEVQRRLTEAIKIDDRVVRVYGFKFTHNRQDEALLIEFFVETLYSNLKFRFSLPYSPTGN